MIEFLVLAACASGKGCDSATAAYYAYNTDLQVWAKLEQKKIENKVGKANLAMLGTISGLVFVKQGSIQIDRHVNLLVGSVPQIQLHWEY